MPKTVLIVEDNPEFQWLLTRSLEMTGEVWDVTTSAEMGAAFAQINRNKKGFDLALVDIGLPDGSGIEVISRLNRLNRETPILVITIMRSEHTLVESIRAGAKGYLLKEDDEVSISKAIKQVLDQEYPISPSLARYLFRLAQTPEKAEGLSDLTRKEISVLQNLSDGFTYQETANRMGVSISTVRTHIQKLYRKLNSNSGPEAVAKAKSIGII